uniref:Uncharacterized protein n=1 Tax=Trichogramma kaykai TaxID=54128 RepID=A0ABD2WUJ9_9HYME
MRTTVFTIYRDTQRRPPRTWSSRQSDALSTQRRGVPTPRDARSSFQAQNQAVHRRPRLVPLAPADLLPLAGSLHTATHQFPAADGQLSDIQLRGGAGHRQGPARRRRRRVERSRRQLAPLLFIQFFILFIYVFSSTCAIPIRINDVRPYTPSDIFAFIDGAWRENDKGK